jgi:hypothetical protein
MRQRRTELLLLELLELLSGIGRFLMSVDARLERIELLLGGEDGEGTDADS